MNQELPRLRLLGISGSLRATSSNTALLQAAINLSPDGIEFILYDGLADLPHFNPDMDTEGSTAPPSVTDLRARLRAADGIIICSPEYAHGVPGALKNALDWIVSSGELMGKPVALINASAHATHAQDSIAETLTVMMANIITEASITAPIQGKKLDAAGMIEDPEISTALRSAVMTLARHIEARRAQNS